jgi:hypothetical protein
MLNKAFYKTNTIFISILGSLENVGRKLGQGCKHSLKSIIKIKAPGVIFNDDGQRMPPDHKNPPRRAKKIDN